MDKVGILVIDDDEVSQSAIRQMLDSEGWTVRPVSQVNQALAELSTGEWSLVILNLSMAGAGSPVFAVLRELALAAPLEDGKVRARVLFLLPDSRDGDMQPMLERERLPYVIKPFHFNDFLEKVSDLLMETSALSSPIRRVRRDAGAGERKLKEARAGHEGQRVTGRNTSMFAQRGDYVMSDEEIAEYERTEQEQDSRKRKKKDFEQR